MASILKKGLAKAQDGVTKAIFGKETPTSIESFFQIVEKNMKGEDVHMSNYKGSILAIVNVASQWGLTNANYTQLTKLVDDYGSKGLKVQCLAPSVVISAVTCHVRTRLTESLNVGPCIPVQPVWRTRTGKDYVSLAVPCGSCVVFMLRREEQESILTWARHIIFQGTNDEILEFAHQFDNADEKFDFFDKGDVNGANTREIFSFLKQKLPNEDGTNDIRWNFNIFLVDQEGNPTKRYQPSKTPYDELKPNIEDLLKKAEK